MSSIDLLCIFGLVILAAIVFVIMEKEKKIKAEGLEVTGIVIDSSRIVLRGARFWTNIVEYVDIEGNQHTAKLNTRTNLSGRRIRVKYIPGQYTHVALVDDYVVDDQ